MRWLIFKLTYRQHDRPRLVDIVYVLSLAHFSNLFHLNLGNSRAFNFNNRKDVNNSRDADNSRDARNIVNSYSRRGHDNITISNCRPCLHPLIFQLSPVLLSTLQLSMFSLLLTFLVLLQVLMLLPPIPVPL